MMHKRRLAGLAAAFALALASPALALSVDEFQKNLTVERLDNGLTLLIYERPEAPVVSFFTHVDVGSAQEVPGITGLAHMFEHMAFKGTTTIGTKDWPAEKKALARVDEAYHAYDHERRKPGGSDPAKLEKLEKAWKDAQEEAGKYIVPNEFDILTSREGAVGLNAFTNADETAYFYSLPANKVELWAFLESERFRDPVFREFYKERDVVLEERRLRTESQPIGRLIEQMLGVAFIAHPYHHPTIGYRSDLLAFSREDAETFYRKYYVPSNMVVAVVGDVNAKAILPMLRGYFSRLPAGKPVEPLRTVEPEQIAEKTIVLHDPSQPIYVEGYHRPAAGDPDDAVYNAMADILSSGRTSRLYRRLVSDDKIAAFAGAFNGFPGDKYPNLMLFFAVPTPGHGDDDVQAAIRDEIERLKTEPVSDEELGRVKTAAKANLIRGLDSDSGIARQLATYQARFGDWKELFREVDRIEKVSKDDIMRVANKTLVPTNRTVAMIVTEQNAGVAKGAEESR